MLGLHNSFVGALQKKFLLALLLRKLYINSYFFPDFFPYLQETTKSLYTPAKDENSFQSGHHVLRGIQVLQYRNVVCKSNTITCGRTGTEEDWLC